MLHGQQIINEFQNTLTNMWIFSLHLATRQISMWNSDAISELAGCLASAPNLWYENVASNEKCVTEFIHFILFNQFRVGFEKVDICCDDNHSKPDRFD